MPPVTIDETIVSSTRIRQMIQAGEPQKAVRFRKAAWNRGNGDCRGPARTDLDGPPPTFGFPRGVSFRRTVCMPLGCSGRAVPGFGGLHRNQADVRGRERLLEVSILDERLELYGETT